MKKMINDQANSMSVQGPNNKEMQIEKPRQSIEITIILSLINYE